MPRAASQNGASAEAALKRLQAIPSLDEVTTGATAKDVVWTRNKTTLCRYRRETEPTHRVPVVLVYALINRPYILDLRPGNSFVEFLLGEGHDVFLIDWGEPGWEDRDTTLDELIGEHIPRAVRHVLRVSGADTYTLLGYCMGGTFATIHAALRPAGLRNLIALTTPIDFADAGALSTWTDPRFLDAELVASKLGNVPGHLIDFGNKMLKPVTNFIGAPALMWERLMEGRDMEPWLAMHKWVNDGVPFPGAAFVQWIRDFYQQNLLASGTYELAGERVDLRNITASLLVVTGEADHLVPPHMSEPLMDLVASGDRTSRCLRAGHVGLLAGSGAQRGLWPLISDWLGERSS
ncbi:MAG: alpha/beta fold hydrolase [Actinobacteria bacterium]|nr:alpha/beta fold hydrolase [Thermoleophilia bacterium]MCB9012352.1 alpha/beta fold hydrolase [Actinomycetota bacterium]